MSFYITIVSISAVVTSFMIWISIRLMRATIETWNKRNSEKNPALREEPCMEELFTMAKLVNDEHDVTTLFGIVLMLEYLVWFNCLFNHGIVRQVDGTVLLEVALFMPTFLSAGALIMWTLPGMHEWFKQKSKKCQATFSLSASFDLLLFIKIKTQNNIMYSVMLLSIMPLHVGIFMMY